MGNFNSLGILNKYIDEHGLKCTESDIKDIFKDIYGCYVNFEIDTTTGYAKNISPKSN